MNNKDVTKSPFSKLRHITIVVKDIERAEQFYSSIGIGPFETPPSHGSMERTLRGKPLHNKVLVREANIGPVILQLVQEIEGESLVTEFMRKKGEGVFHLGFVVDDVDKEEAKAVKLGLKVTQRARREDGSGNAFFDTEALGGVVLLIRQNPREK